MKNTMLAGIAVGITLAERHHRFQPSRFRRPATVFCSLCLGLIGMSFVAPTGSAITIEEARSAGVGVAVTIDNAVVTTTTDLIYSTNAKDFFIQDATGGIRVWGQNDDIDVLLSLIAEGDSIDISAVWWARVVMD